MSETLEQDKKFIKQAVELAEVSFREGGFPVGALIVRNQEVIARGKSQGNLYHDPTHHAETAAIREACATLKTRSLTEVTLYSSLEPCVMCFAACFWARVPRIVYAGSKECAHVQYYEGTMSLARLHDSWQSKKEVIFLGEQEAHVAALIREWEKSVGLV